MSAWLLPILLAAFAATAWRYGVDGRDGCDWKPLSERPLTEVFTRPNTPARDLARLARAIARFNAGQINAWERYLRLLHPRSRPPSPRGLDHHGQSRPGAAPNRYG